MDGLHPYVEEADSVVQLGLDVVDLAADRGQGTVVCMCVVCSGDADC